MCNLKIEEVDHFNFLGLIIDKNMKWHTHEQKVENKIQDVNGILHKFKYIFLYIILFLIYTSLIESHINYCLLLWGTNYDKIFKLQKQAIRTISLNHFKAHTSPLFKSMNLLDIRDIYQLQILKLYYKVKNSLVPSYFTNFTIYNRNNVHTSRYSLRNKRVNMAIPPKEYLMSNVQYQLLELMSRFDEDLLQRAEVLYMKSFIQTHFTNQYEVYCIQETCYVCALV